MPNSTGWTGHTETARIIAREIALDRLDTWLDLKIRRGHIDATGRALIEEMIEDLTSPDCPWDLPDSGDIVDDIASGDDASVYWAIHEVPTRPARPAGELTPASHCVVQWTVTTNSPPRRTEAAFAASLEDARKMIPVGLTRRPAASHDWGVIETWRWQPHSPDG